ncbi:MAG: hypothetical protein ACI7YS_10545 [Flavobacterium sp.]
MDYIIEIAFMIFTFSVITILTGIVSFVIYHLLLFSKRKVINQKLKVQLSDLNLTYSLTALTLLFSTYQTFTIFYPPKSFYKEEFEQYTGIKFPKSGKILNPHSIHPRMRDDFAILAKFDKQDYESILSAIRLNRNFEPDTIDYAYREGLHDLKYKEEDFFTLSHIDHTLKFKVTFQKNGQLIAFEKYYWDD